jgi:hypothetical protein
MAAFLGDQTNPTRQRGDRLSDQNDERTPRVAVADRVVAPSDRSAAGCADDFCPVLPPDRHYASEILLLADAYSRSESESESSRAGPQRRHAPGSSTGDRTRTRPRRRICGKRSAIRAPSARTEPSSQPDGLIIGVRPRTDFPGAPTSRAACRSSSLRRQLPGVRPADNTTTAS